MRFSVIRLLLGAALALPFMACNSVHVPGTEEEGPALSIEEVLSKPEEITFETVRAYVLSPACLRCHSGGRVEARVDLSTYASVTNPRPGMRASVIPFSTARSSMFRTMNATGNLQMPPVGQRPQLTEKQKQVVFLWISNGAVEKPGEKPEVEVTIKEELEPYFLKPETIDYAAVNKYVFEESCNECHSSNGSKPDEDAILFGADTTTYKTLAGPGAFPEVIELGKPKKSVLYQAVANQEMPSAAAGYDPVNAFKMKLLRLWILNCAIESVPAPENDTLMDKPKNPEQVRECVEL